MNDTEGGPHASPLWITCMWPFCGLKLVSPAFCHVNWYSYEHLQYNCNAPS